MAYKGFTSWNAWNVSLWVNGDESMYRFAQDLVKQHGRGQAAKMLANELHGQRTPDGAEYNVTGIRQSLQGM
jgi:hypothetical protein